jgi:magnesium chelatase subunit I
VISSAEQRALRNRERVVVPRIGDVYAAMPAITGKLELEYEGEMKGADNVARELIRTAVAKTFDAYFNGVNMQQVVQWFDLGGEVKLADTAAAAEIFATLKNIQGLSEKLAALGVKTRDMVEEQVAAAEFVLEGLYAHKRIGRNEERVFVAGVKQAPRPEPERPDQPFRGRKSFN